MRVNRGHERNFLGVQSIPDKPTAKWTGPGQGSKIAQTKCPLGSSYWQRPFAGPFRKGTAMPPSLQIPQSSSSLINASRCNRAPLGVAAKRVFVLCSALALTMSVNQSAQGRGLLIPDDKQVPPLAMVNHQVTITIDDQVAE